MQQSEDSPDMGVFDCAGLMSVRDKDGNTAMDILIGYFREEALKELNNDNIVTKKSVENVLAAFAKIEKGIHKISGVAARQNPREEIKLKKDNNTTLNKAEEILKNLHKMRDALASESESNGTSLAKVMKRGAKTHPFKLEILRDMSEPKPKTLGTVMKAQAIEAREDRERLKSKEPKSATSPTKGGKSLSESLLGIHRS